MTQCIAAAPQRIRRGAMAGGFWACWRFWQPQPRFPEWEGKGNTLAQPVPETLQVAKAMPAHGLAHPAMVAALWRRTARSADRRGYGGRSRYGAAAARVQQARACWA